MIVSNRFLLGLTRFDQLHDDWIALAGLLSNPRAHTNTKLVIDEICESKN